MAKDTTIPVRRAALIRLKANAPLITICPKAAIFPQASPPEPTFPFVRLGSPTLVPIVGACVDGAQHIFAVHGFAKGRRDGQGREIETAEDHTGRLGAAIASALGGAAVQLVGGAVVKFKWEGSQLVPDVDEPNCFHSIQRFRARVIG